jgi:streptogramin lyase
VLETLQGSIFPNVPVMPMSAIRFQGNIAATDAITGSVVRWDSNSSSWDLLTHPGSFTGPVGLATNGSDLWVADYGWGTVFKILPSYILEPVASGLSGPTGLAYYSPDGSLLVVEATAGQLARIDPVTGNVTTLAEGLRLSYTFGFVNGVAVGPSDAIYVTGRKADVLYRIEIHR